MDILHLEKPTIYVDKEQVIANLEKMVYKCKNSGITLRPHLKTHQSASIAEWMKPFNITGITVSSIDMAEYFADNGWKDILVAVPVNIHQINRINTLAKKCDLHILIENTVTAKKIVEETTTELNVWIEIDIGYHRTGIDYENNEVLIEVANIIKKKKPLTLKGILTHAGHAYNAKSINDLKDVYRESTNKMIEVKRFLEKNGFFNLAISTGDTPTCSIVEKFDKEISEVRPGNFFFNDLMQLNLGSCQEKEIAMVTACPVISKDENLNKLVIYGGGIHLSKEHIDYNDQKQIFGLIAKLNPNTAGRTPPIPNVYVNSLSQEHGIVTGPIEFIKSTNIGDVLLVLPVHSCMVANLYKNYYTFEGEKLTSFRMP